MVGVTSWQDAYIRLEIDPKKRLVSQIRNGVRHESLEAMDGSFSELYRQMEKLVRGDYVLLQDLRASRGRNDPDFERLMVKHLPRISRDFQRVGVLVATQVGRLQIERFFLEDATLPPGRAFTQEQDCLRWLLA